MRVGVYLGSKADSPENVEKQLLAWGEYLSDIDLEAFGSATLPKSASDLYDHYPTAERRPSNPATRITTAFAATKEYISRRNPDVVVQLWRYLTHGPGVTTAAFRSNTASVARFSGDHFEEFRAFSSVRKGLVFGLHNVLGRLPLYLADHIIVLGPNGADSVVSHGATEERVTVLPPAAGLEDRFQPPTDQAAVREQLGLQQDREIALYVGRISHRKGIRFLSKTIEQVLQHREMTFVIVGTGELEEVLEQRFPSDNLRLPGYVPYSKVHRYYQAADFYVHPSAYEGIPLVILEALQSDLPVIARDAGDIEYVTGHTVDTPEAMTEAILNEQYDTNWEHREAFSTSYQSKTLQRILFEAIS